ncbi:hypothetical protein [Shewanella halifaxensis]|uniref:hypothetical protein n=1 Tax=Shewanella halifaxensis TaxID=271098 RepID=UPI000D590881|nr:hypothetical protein [Shewanella halifaxensis]
MKFDRDDHDTILAYVTAKHREAGYTGPCFIAVERLMQLHLSNARAITQLAIANMMNSKAK